MQIAWIAAAVAGLLVLLVGSITFVYRDAPRRGMDPDQWSGVVALTGGLGLLLYLALRGGADEAGSDDEFAPSSED